MFDRGSLASLGYRTKRTCHPSSQVVALSEVSAALLELVFADHWPPLSQQVLHVGLAVALAHVDVVFRQIAGYVRSLGPVDLRVDLEEAGDISASCWL